MIINASIARSPNNRLAFFGLILILISSGGLGAQETVLEELPGLRENAVIVRIVSRIVEQNQRVVWNSVNSQVTITGRPVGLQLVSSELVVSVQFTPFLKESGRHTLVTKAQIWMSTPNEGISYHTTMQTIQLGFMEQVYFFPLGSMQVQEGSKIEIQLALEPYDRYSSANTGRSRRRVISP